MSLVLLGTAAYVVWRSESGRYAGLLRGAILDTGGLLLVLIGLSRVYVGAHWASDVLGGWLLGAVWLLPLLVLYERLLASSPICWRERSQSQE